VLFIHKIAKKWADAEAAGMKPDMANYPELRTGDEIVGILKDPALLAALAVLDEQHANFALAWPVAPEAGSPQMELARATKANLNAAREMFWHELRRAFKVDDVEGLALRQGYQYPVFVKIAVPKRSRSMVLSLGELLGQMTGDAPDCGNPDCPIHGNGRRADMSIMDVLARFGV